ncbi:hypothetical protein Q7C36_012931 [Tachysurus vachellii]|uniref:Uncharacterized protein n=1 Tax=Tachysurus vachellii TaxID=175792 RepID=A0AA88SQA5_TACVA|nr:hypothetical protein Q7C36_012931 [Tachysurus vachellii]
MEESQRSSFKSATFSAPLRDCAAPQLHSIVWKLRVNTASLLLSTAARDFQYGMIGLIPSECCVLETQQQ